MRCVLCARLLLSRTRCYVTHVYERTELRTDNRMPDKFNSVFLNYLYKNLVCCSEASTACFPLSFHLRSVITFGTCFFVHFSINCVFVWFLFDNAQFLIKTMLNSCAWHLASVWHFTRAAVQLIHKETSEKVWLHSAQR